MKKILWLPFLGLAACSQWQGADDSRWLLEPAGLSWVDCAPGPRGEALAYDFVHEEVPGRSFAPSPDACGGHSGLRMSALELAQLLAYALHTEVLLHKEVREEMLLRLWGWYPAGQEGPYPVDEATARVWHPGDLYALAGPEEHTCVLRYPRQVEAVLLVNSDIYTALADVKRPCKLLQKAYAKALVAP